MRHPQLQQHLRPRRIVHQKQVHHVAIDADQPLRRIRDDRRKADDERHQHITDPMPVPIHNRIRGAMATIGTVCSRIVYG